MNSIQVVKTWPNDATVEAIQGKIDKVYPANTTASGKVVQNAILVDAGNESVKLVVWDHPDLKPYEGKEVVLHSNRAGNGRFGGVTVKHGSYVAKKDGKNHKEGDTIPTFELSVSKLGTFQLVEVYNAQAGKSAPVSSEAPTKAEELVKSNSTGVHGQTVGMAINNTCDNLTARGETLEPDVIWKIASSIIRVAQKLEKGELADEAERTNPF